MKAQDFDRDVPPWDELDDEARKNKIEFIKRELLDVVDLAGYEIRKKM